MTLAQFTTITADYVALGRPDSRELAYAEQESPPAAFVIFRTRRSGSAVFERVSLILENNRWMIASWMISAAPLQ